MIGTAVKTIGKSYLYMRGAISRPRLLKATINVTNYCNVRCKTCAIWNIYEKDPTRAADEMSLTDYYKLFDELQGISYIEFSGGEPFMRQDVVDMVSGAASRIKSLSTCSLTTNGLLTNVILDGVLSLLNSLPSGIRLVVGVSLDGTPDIHYSQRRVETSFERALETFLGLRELSIKYPQLEPHISYTISTYNAGELPKFRDYLKQQNIDFNDVTITYQHAGFLYRTAKASIKNVKDVLDDVNYAIKNRRIKFGGGLFSLIKSHFYSYYLKKLRGYIANPDKMVLPCAALTLSAYVDPYGDVYPCVIWDENIGNLRENSFTEIYQSPVAEQVRKKIAEEKCPNCWTPCEAQPSYLMAFPKVLAN
jgi:MoaA/NifB/PqqE/SkfB family radical SAM enzyme